jgi:hypothetical protein
MLFEFLYYDLVVEFLNKMIYHYALKLSLVNYISRLETVCLHKIIHVFEHDNQSSQKYFHHHFVDIFIYIHIYLHQALNILRSI